MTRAPWLAAIRAARTPPDPPPMTNRSVSNSAMSAPERLATLFHFRTKFIVHRFVKALRPLAHIGHAGLNRLWLLREQLLAERRLVEGDEVFQFLLGKVAGVDLRHLLADLFLASRQRLGDDDRDLVQVFLIVQ